MRFISFFLMLFIAFNVNGQHRVTIIVDSLPSHTQNHLFVAGNFNMWNPGDSSYLMVKENGNWKLNFELPEGHYEYKITRGNWGAVETNKDFKPFGNRSFDLHSDTTLRVSIGAWEDTRPKESKMAMHTTTDEVHIMDTAFFMPQLDRYRRIWIYLPKLYATSGKRYPVLYMHDGQNVFDAATSYSGEWGVDEFLDTLNGNCRKVIVVAVDNGLAQRMNEYNPWAFMKFGKGEGDLYVDFLVKTLKPFIDKHYRTLPKKKNTSIAGSSMGGLISLYAVLKYPEVFGNAGIFSPAFWTASGIDSMVLARAKKMNAALYFYAGGNEGEQMVPDMLRIEKEIRKNSRSDIKERIDQQAKHNEAAWRKHFPEFYRWVYCE